MKAAWTERSGGRSGKVREAAAHASAAVIPPYSVRPWLQLGGASSDSGSPASEAMTAAREGWFIGRQRASGQDRRQEIGGKNSQVHRSVQQGRPPAGQRQASDKKGQREKRDALVIKAERQWQPERKGRDGHCGNREADRRQGR